MDYLVDRGVNAAYDGVKKFAQSDTIKRKAPILSNLATDAATSLKDRLKGGY
jgi:hypothetical protein